MVQYVLACSTLFQHMITDEFHMHTTTVCEIYYMKTQVYFISCFRHHTSCQYWIRTFTRVMNSSLMAQ